MRRTGSGRPDVAPSRDGDPLLPGRRALTGRRPATARTSRPHGTATRYCPDVAPHRRTRSMARSGGTPGASRHLGTPGRYRPGRRASRDTRHGPFGIKLLKIFVVEPGEPGREPVYRGLEVGVEVDEIAQALGQPGHGDPFLAAPLLEFLDAPVGEVHRFSLGDRRLDDLLVG